MGDLHYVFAKLDSAPDLYVRVGAGRDWPTAQALWTQLDDARRAGNLPGVEYLAVRSAGDPDPRWSHARRAHAGEVAPLVGDEIGPAGVRIRNGYATREAAARALARWTGRYAGLGGGWIYRVDGAERRPVIQGWWQFATMLRNQGRILERDGRWYVAAPLVATVVVAA